MPLHDWSEREWGWDGVHLLWLTEILRWVKPRLPAGFRAYIGTVPTVAVGGPIERPDVAVRQWPEDIPATKASSLLDLTGDEPDEEVAVVTLDPAMAVYVEIQGRLISAVELIAPRNKDRPDSRAIYATRYLGYLHQAVHLLLVDVHRLPKQFSFADRIAEELHLEHPSCPPPMAVTFAVGGRAAAGGRTLLIWRRPLTVGAPLPIMKLPLSIDQAVPVDLEQTYTKAAADAYLS
jgi:Protein of unknown function (DUF4058)